MTRDPIDERQLPPLVTPPALHTRHLLVCGVAVACVLGGGLGLWARPALGERARTAPPRATAPAPRHQLQIVVADLPTPADGPATVLPAASETPAPVLAARPDPAEPEPQAPTRPAQALVKVKTIAPAPVTIAAKPERRPAPRPKLIAVKAKAPPAQPPARLVKAAAPARPPKAIRKPDRMDAKPARALLAKASRPAARPKLQLARVEAKAVRVLAHALPHAARPEPKLEKVRLVRPAPDRDRKAEKPKAQKLAAAAPRPMARKPPKLAPVVRVYRQPAPPPVHAAGLMKVANTSRCAFSDPGAAVVCANPSLGAADRQLNRAYRDAQAAGVPAWALQRQQQRWLAARTAAAREAPWAVHDVYQARIAELNGMARDAQGSN